MNQYSKITPKWGKNIYNLWGCESLEFDDPEKEKIVQPLRSNPKKISFKQMLAFRKFNKIVCMDCKHYITKQCSFSNEEIEHVAQKYKSLNPKCSVCDMPLTFHHLLLKENSQETLCIMCEEAKINGTLKGKEKKKKTFKILEICEGIFILLMMILTSAEPFLDGVIDWADYFFIGLFSLMIIGFLSYYLIKRRKKKKIEEEY